MQRVALIFILIILSIRHSCERRSNVSMAETNYVVRVFNFSTVDFTGQPYVTNLKWTVRDMKQCLSLDAIAKRTYVMRRLVIRFERCRDLEIACEDFQTWSASKEICSFFKMKNQVWSILHNTMNLHRFPETCPRIEKGIYEMRNLCLDDAINWMLLFYNEIPKYYWKVHSYFYDQKNELEYENHMHFRILSYTKRKRTAISLP